MQSTPTNSNIAAEHAVLECYEEIARASQRMLKAAERADWDDLIAAEMVCANLIHKVGRLSQEAEISESGNRRRMQIIHRVLADDAQIRNLVEPRLVTLEGFLRGRSNGKRLDNTYRH